MVVEAWCCTLDDECAQGPRFPTNGNSQKGGESFLSQFSEMFVGVVLFRRFRRYGAQIFYCLTRNTAADGQAHLTQSGGCEADIASHDEFIAISLE
jgi:hypothetical protein